MSKEEESIKLGAERAIFSEGNVKVANVSLFSGEWELHKRAAVSKIN